MSVCVHKTQYNCTKRAFTLLIALPPGISSPPLSWSSPLVVKKTATCLQTYRWLLHYKTMETWREYPPVSLHTASSSQTDNDTLSTQTTGAWAHRASGPQVTEWWTNSLSSQVTLKDIEKVRAEWQERREETKVSGPLGLCQMDTLGYAEVTEESGTHWLD